MEKKSEGLLTKNGVVYENANAEKKRKLLATKMNKLNLGRSFDRYFLDDSSHEYYIDGTFRRMSQQDVITLKEFIDLNFLLKDGAILQTRQEEFRSLKFSSLRKDAVSFQNLVSLLKKYEFDWRDWPWIERKDARPDINMLSKEEILQIPLVDFFTIFEHQPQINSLEIYFHKLRCEILIEDLMKITDEIVYMKLISLLSILQKSQRRLRRFGFKEIDGPFMQASLDF